MKHLNRLNPILIINSEKSLTEYQFVAKYLDIFDYNIYIYISNNNLYQLVAYDKEKLVGVTYSR